MVEAGEVGRVAVTAHEGAGHGEVVVGVGGGDFQIHDALVLERQTGIDMDPGRIGISSIRGLEDVAIVSPGEDDAGIGRRHGDDRDVRTIVPHVGADVAPALAGKDRIDAIGIAAGGGFENAAQPDQQPLRTVRVDDDGALAGEGREVGDGVPVEIDGGQAGDGGGPRLSAIVAVYKARGGGGGGDGFGGGGGEGIDAGRIEV